MNEDDKNTLCRRIVEMVGRCSAPWRCSATQPRGGSGRGICVGAWRPWRPDKRRC